MIIIAFALEHGNPFAYLLLFMILYPPIMVIAFDIIEKLKLLINEKKIHTL